MTSMFITAGLATRIAIALNPAERVKTNCVENRHQFFCSAGFLTQTGMKLILRHKWFSDMPNNCPAVICN